VENDGVEERYGNDNEAKRIFLQQVEQPHGVSPGLYFSAIRHLPVNAGIG
jgi:hypothetical protein